MEQGNARTHAMRALAALRELILSGEFTGGMRLFEVPLAELLDISRTPVREALLRLSEEGLLESAKGGGFLVRTFSFQDVVDAIELRGVIEGTATRLAAERGISDGSIANLQQILEDLDQCFGARDCDLDFDSYRQLNEALHKEWAALSGSVMVKREVERISRLPFASPSAFLNEHAGLLGNSLLRAQEQHQSIVNAIINREGSRAEALSREHALMARTNLELLMKDRNLKKYVPTLALVT